MRQTWLLVDGNYMANRAFHSTGGLSHHGVSTGISFGFLRDIETITELFSASRVILAFDSRTSLREQIYPNYKISRKTKVRTPEETQSRKLFIEELNRLIAEILPAAGYSNVIQEFGYEADDVIAQVSDELPRDTDAVIVTSDGDLLQCLRRHVVYYNPHTKLTTTVDSFIEKWGITPDAWVNVKAWAGCGTDDIEGLEGVGEVIAARYVAGTLNPGTPKKPSKTYQKFAAGIDIYNRNLDLVRLPYPGLVLPKLLPDKVTPEKLAAVRRSLGIQVKNAVRSFNPLTPGLL
jgi:DNA polymerase-1